MDKELQEKIQKAKQEYKDNPPIKKKGCSSCKKKKQEVTQLPPIVEEEIWVPTSGDIKLAYAELTSLLGVKEDKKPFIEKVYKYIFNETFDWGCRSCVNAQARKFRIYVTGK
jgi:hypothetical protein